MTRLAWPPLALALLGLPLTACGYTQNVRAYRAYAYESPSLVVALDRADDLGASLDMIETLLTSTPYSPGDEWVGKLALSDSTAAAIKSELKQLPPYDSTKGYEVPVMKIYRTHLTRVLADAKGQGKYPSLLDALGALGGKGVEIKGHWQDLNDRIKDHQAADEAFEKKYSEVYPPSSPHRAGQPEASSVVAARQAVDEAKSALKAAERALEKDVEVLEKGGDTSLSDRGKMLVDLTAAVSTAYRLELESLAMIPVIAVQAARSLPRAAGELAQKPRALAGRLFQLSEVPDYIDATKDKMRRQTRLLELMTEALVVSSKTTVEATAGFLLKESVVDQVVGVTLDSFRANGKAGGEALFYTAAKQETKPSDSAQSSSGGATKDYTGAQRRLTYEVKPILFMAFNLDLGFDYIKLPNAAKINLGYKTDRVFSSNGTIDNTGSLAQSIGVKGLASDVLDLGLGVLGVKTNFKRAHFTAGTVHYVDFNTGQAVGDPRNPTAPLVAPFQIQYTQIDVGYDIAFLLGEKAGRAYLEELVIGARYFDYSLPRILYELENQTPLDASGQPTGTGRFTYFNESVPQTVESKYYMGGASVRVGPGEAPIFAPFLDFGFYIGGGPTSYVMRTSKAVPCSSTTVLAKGQGCIDSADPQDPSGTNRTKTGAFGFNTALALGARVRFARPSSRLRLSGEILFRGELIYANTNSTTTPTTDSTGAATSAPKQHQIDFGAADIFWGPRFNFVGEF